MADKIGADDASRLVLEVVSKVLDPTEGAPVIWYPAWSANDGMWDPRDGQFYGREVNFGGTDLWSKYTEDADLKARQFEELNMDFAKSVTTMPKVRKKFCSFCKRNGESPAFFGSHRLYENGRMTCPVLQACVCKICGQKGHTLSHCPHNTTRVSITKLIHRCNNM